MSEKQLVSPRIEALRKGLAEGKSGALELFWHEVAEAGAPLIEAIEDEPNDRLVTFLWRDQGDKENVVAVGPALAGWRDWHNPPLTRLLGNDPRSEEHTS